MKSKDKPFKGYNPKKHARTGGLNAQYRENITENMVQIFKSL